MLLALGGRSLGLGSNLAVNTNGFQPPVTMVHQPPHIPLYAGQHLFQHFAFLRRYSVPGFAVVWVSPVFAARFKPFGPLALAGCAQAAVVFAALRRLGGAPLFGRRF